VTRQAEWLEANPHADVASVARTLNTGRLHQAHRLAVVAADIAGALSGLRAGSGASFVRGEVRLNRVPRVAFLFTGQGAQKAGMGLALAAAEPSFRAALERCDALLRPHLPRPLLELLASASPAELSATGVAQPALFSLEYALFELWRGWGVRPDFLLGHSLGEYVAAVAAGIFSLEDAIDLVRLRGQLMQALPSGGGMAAVFASASNAPLALSVMAVELVGAYAFPHAAIVCVLAYFLTGHRSIYPSQRVLQGKTGSKPPHVKAIKDWFSSQ
jgi:acyl transferase domain-containing protein